MNHVLVTGRDFDRHNMSGKLGRKREFAGPAHGAVFGHEERSASGHTLDYTENAAAPPELRMRGHLDRASHPGELSGFGDDRLVVLKHEFEDGHCRPGDAVLHE